MPICEVLPLRFMLEYFDGEKIWLTSPQWMIIWTLYLINENISPFNLNKLEENSFLSVLFSYITFWVCFLFQFDREVPPLRFMLELFDWVKICLTSPQWMFIRNIYLINEYNLSFYFNKIEEASLLSVLFSYISICILFLLFQMFSAFVVFNIVQY